MLLLVLIDLLGNDSWLHFLLRRNILIFNYLFDIKVCPHFIRIICKLYMTKKIIISEFKFQTYKQAPRPFLLYQQKLVRRVSNAINKNSTFVFSTKIERTCEMSQSSTTIFCLQCDNYNILNS